MLACYFLWLYLTISTILCKEVVTIKGIGHFSLVVWGFSIPIKSTPILPKDISKVIASLRWNPIRPDWDLKC